MKIINSISDIRQILKEHKNNNKSIGFVPTMGYFHKGHQSLMLKAKEENDIAVVSIFVNPLQFGPNEDYLQYPRDLERDKRIAEAAGIDYLFIPPIEEIYPKQIKTKVTVQEITEKLCGKSRPGHFTGVTTVVNKLFNIIQPDKAYFGLKDAQQIAVIEQMVFDLNIPVTIVRLPIVRENDGLAMSSRNVYLSDEERKEATVLYKSLLNAKELILSGETDVKKVKTNIKDVINTSRLANIDYVEILTYPELKEPQNLTKNLTYIIALAVKFGKTRLIDNIIFEI